MSVDLSVQNPLGVTTQPVQDQNGNSSILAIGSKNVGIGTGAVNPNLPLTVSGNPGTAPIMELASQSNEASIRYICNDNLVWHVGSGAGARSFFFWNPEHGIVLTLSPEGTVHTRTLQVTELPTAPSAQGFETLVVESATGKIFKGPSPLR